LASDSDGCLRLARDPTTATSAEPLPNGLAAGVVRDWDPALDATSGAPASTPPRPEQQSGS